MSEHQEWRPVHDFWFPPGLEQADAEAHRRIHLWWFGGGANAELPRFAATLEAARAGRLDHWRSEPLGRLTLVVVLDQFPRGLFPGTPEAYTSDPAALRIAEEGLANGHYDSLAWPWQKTPFLMAMGHAEGPNHLARMDRVVALQEAIEAPPHLVPLFRFHASQARAHRDVIARFGRFPHRNAILGRHSTPEEAAYIERGEFVHNRRP